VNGAFQFLWAHTDAILVIAPMIAGVVLTILPAGRVAQGAAIGVSFLVASLSVAGATRLLAGASSPVDALGVIAGAVIGVMAAAAFLAFAMRVSRDYVRRAQPIALGLALVLTGAALGAVMERDVLRLVLLLQTALLAAAALTGLSASDDRRAATAALSGVMVALAGGALAVAGGAFLHAAAGAVDLTDVARRSTTSESDHGVWLGAALLLAGVAIMAGLAPLHADPADRAARTAHGAAPFVVVIVRIAAFVALVRVYGVTQAIAMPGVATAFAYALAALGAVGVVAGAMQAIGATDARRLAAHALTAQFGCALIGLAAGGDDGAIAALFVVAAGAMTALAIVVGAAAARGQDSFGAPMASLDGLARTHPGTASAIMIAALGLTGAPLTAAFLGKWLSIEAALARGWYWAAAAIVASSFAAVFVAGQVVERLYFRKRPQAFGPAPSGMAPFAPALLVSVLATLVFGWNAAVPLDAARMAAGALTPVRVVMP
jgi:multicomponent Na+:H+ antiporter subunit D